MKANKIRKIVKTREDWNLWREAYDNFKIQKHKFKSGLAESLGWNIINILDAVDGIHKTTDKDLENMWTHYGRQYRRYQRWQNLNRDLARALRK